jgi:hypothetical protein
MAKCLISGHFHGWTVTPTKVERRAGAGTAAAVPPTEDRRTKAEYRVALGHAMANGWICFESASEKRRLAPYPENWETLPDDEFARLLETATPVPRRPQSSSETPLQRGGAGVI